MVEYQLLSRGITDARIIQAVLEVPRHEFVPRKLKSRAYGDCPLPIGHGQTISQPYIVALMLQLAELDASARVLDIGTGSGYQAALLSRICKQVFSIEIVESLAMTAFTRLNQLGYRNVELRCGDGSLGWPEHQPYDAIIAAAAPSTIPETLTDQLKIGGRLLIPVGENQQWLEMIKKTKNGETRQKIVAVSFVPMTGEGR